jgi:hypothetical protein
MILSYILMQKHQLQTKQSNVFISHITRRCLTIMNNKIPNNMVQLFWKKKMCKCVCRNWRHSGIFYTCYNNFSLNIQIWIHCDMVVKYILLIWFLLFLLCVSPTLAEFYFMWIVFLVLCPDKWVKYCWCFPTFFYQHKHILNFLAYFPYFEKMKVGLWYHHAVCVSVNPPCQLLNAWTNLYETWYIYHGTWAHLNGILHKSLPSICVCMCIPPTVARWRLGKVYTSFHC